MGEGSAPPPTLLRSTPASFTIETFISNHATPDETTISEFGVESFFPNGTPDGITVNENPMPLGALSDRSIGTHTMHIDPKKTGRGVFDVIPTEYSLTAHHEANGISETRDVTVNQLVRYNGAPTTIAVDPISDNYVGNGDIELGEAGFKATRIQQNNSFPYNTRSDIDAQQWGDRTMLVFYTDDRPDYITRLEADIQLGVPDEASLFSFEYYMPDPTYAIALSGLKVRVFDEDSGSSETLLTLNGIVHTEDFLTASTLIDPSRLAGFTSPKLYFEASGTGGANILYLDNIRWAAVPEPAGLLVGLGLLAGGLIRPKRRRRALI